MTRVLKSKRLSLQSLPLLKAFVCRIQIPKKPVLRTESALCYLRNVDSVMFGINLGKIVVEILISPFLENAFSQDIVLKTLYKRIFVYFFFASLADTLHSSY